VHINLNPMFCTCTKFVIYLLLPPVVTCSGICHVSLMTFQACMSFSDINGSEAPGILNLVTCQLHTSAAFPPENLVPIG
jgi:hypothetical protein